MTRCKLAIVGKNIRIVEKSNIYKKKWFASWKKQASKIHNFYFQKQTFTVKLHALFW